MKKQVLPLMSVVLTCLFPCVFMFTQNAGEANFKDIFPFFFLFLATAAVGFLLCLAIFRNAARAGFFTDLCMLVVINFALVARGVERFLPWFHSKYLLAVIFLMLLGLMVLLLKKKPDLSVGCVLLALAFGGVMFMNVMTAVPKLLAVAAHEKPQENIPAEVTFRGQKRNVYYLLFDEYGGDENLETYFGFDNSGFYGELEERGFSVSHTTYNTESYWTDTLVPNLLNLDYVVSDDMPAAVRRSYLEKPFLYKLFWDNGYHINLINHRAYLSDTGARELTTDQVEDTISKYLLENSLYYKIDFLREAINYRLFKEYRDNYAGPLNNALDRLDDCWRYAEDGPTLTVSYIQSPHAPFVYNADGSLRELSTAWYWKDESLYPGQLQFINSRILSAVDQIQQNDPDSVIILLSDHGARVPVHMVEQFGGPEYDEEKECMPMQSTLLSVCVPGTEVDLEGDTGINGTRRTINEAFGTELEMIPPKKHGGPKRPEAPASRKDRGDQPPTREKTGPMDGQRQDGPGSMEPERPEMPSDHPRDMMRRQPENGMNHREPFGMTGETERGIDAL